MEIQHQISTLVNFNSSQLVPKKCVPASLYKFGSVQLKKGPRERSGLLHTANFSTLRSSAEWETISCTGIPV